MQMSTANTSRRQALAWSAKLPRAVEAGYVGAAPSQVPRRDSAARAATPLLQGLPRIPALRSLAVWTEDELASRLGESLGRLGGGTFGRVTMHRAKDVDTSGLSAGNHNQLVALKTFREACNDTDREREISVLDILSVKIHPHVARALGAAFLPGAEMRWQGFVMPVYDMNLADWMSMRLGVFQDWQVAGIATQLWSALAHLHDLRIVHRDVKAENVLLEMLTNAPLRCLLSDFGWSRHDIPLSPCG